MKRYLVLLFIVGAGAPLAAQTASDTPAPTIEQARTAIEVTTAAPTAAPAVTPTVSSAPAAIVTQPAAAATTSAAPTSTPTVEPAQLPVSVATSATTPEPTVPQADEKARVHRETPQGGAAEDDAR